MLVAHAAVPDAQAAGPTLVGYDGSDAARHAIAAAAPLLGAGPALVVHVWPRPSRVVLWNPLVDGAGPLAEAAELLDQSSREAAQRLAADGAQQARAAGFDADQLSVPVEQRSWRTLLEPAEQRQARVIVVGSHGWGAAEVALGTVADRVTTHAARLVLIVPASGVRDRAASAPAPRAPRD